MDTATNDELENSAFLYAQASEAMHDELRRSVVQLLSPRFPQVSALQWWQVYHHCRPDIWVFDGQLTPAGDGMLKLIAWTSLLHGPAVGEVDRYRPAYLYLAGKVELDLIGIQRVLATHQGQHTPSATEAYLQALQALQQEDIIATYCQQHTYFTTYEEPTSEQQSDSSTVLDEAFKLEGQMATLVGGQWRALQDWLAQKQNHLRPWDQEAFEFYLKWPASLVERLLFPVDVPSEDPAQYPTVFTLERLAQVQVLLLTHGFSLP